MRNLHAAFARRHWFNAHYVHDRASALRRFGARPLKKQWKGALIDRPDGRQTRQTS
jgi:hypothetical protein